MSQPALTDVHIDAILTNISVAYIQDQSRFIATQVFPIVPTDKKSDLYFVYTKGDWFRDEAQRRAPATESAGSGYGLTTDRYQCDVWAMHKDIDNQTRQNADNPLNLDRDATQFVTQRLLLKQEKVWTNKYFKTGIWGTAGSTDYDTSAHNGRWSDYLTSDPIDDIETVKATILQNTGYLPNTIVMSYNSYRKVRNHPDIVDRLKYTQGITGKTITPDMLANMFDVERVLVAMAVENTAPEGVTDSFSFVQGDNVLVCYSAPNPGLLVPSAGYTFMWRGVSAGLGSNVGVSRWWNDDRKADRIEGEVAFDDKLVASDMGILLYNVVA